MKWVHRSFLFLMLSFSVAVSCAADSEGNLSPGSLQNAKVGDWVEYQSVSKQGDAVSTSRFREKVIAVNTDTITIQTTTLKPDGSSEFITSSETPRKAFYTPLNQANDDTHLTNGDATLTVGTEKLACTWVKLRQKAGSMETETTIHTSPRVPFGGIVKVETSASDGLHSEQILKAYGSGK